ncbi:hypothetical protein ElyMa_002931300 [Elysia marginata]|uniref:Uncharacterized protein n=1 Tax=Elysia marginata TaxID=1093978 RepID=A0AAV4I479_9GAST|nr:hypothetical protein ElyMa_002931300 [Elysia marginata]
MRLPTGRREIRCRIKISNDDDDDDDDDDDNNDNNDDDDDDNDDNDDDDDDDNQLRLAIQSIRVELLFAATS